MSGTIQATKATKTPKTVGKVDGTNQKKGDKGVDLKKLNNQQPKWTFSSRVKNLLIEGRKESKIQAWKNAQEKELAALKKAEHDRKVLWDKTAVSLPFHIQRTEHSKDFEVGRTVSLASPTVETSGANSSRAAELERCTKDLRETDFKALFREDRSTPHEWIVEHKLALQPLAQAMKDRMFAALDKRDPATLSQDELHDIAVKVWSILIPDLHNGYQQYISEESKHLVQELLQACTAAPEFEKLDQAKRNDAIKGMFYFAYFNRGIQTMLCEKSVRLQELEAIPAKQRTPEQKAELAKEEAGNMLKFSIAQFGAVICGLQLEGKTMRVLPTEQDKACGEAFYRSLCDEALSRAGVEREAPSSKLKDHQIAASPQSGNGARLGQIDSDLSLHSSKPINVKLAHIDNEVSLTVRNPTGEGE